MNPRGFGFVTLATGGDDVFIPPSGVGGAMHGDRVQIRHWKSPKGHDGEVVKVVARRLTQVVGTLRRVGGSVWLEADDLRLRTPMSVVGEVPRGIRPGIEVIATIKTYPRAVGEAPQVEVVEKLGPAGVAAVEVQKIKIREAIEEAFPDEVLQEADTLELHLGRNLWRSYEDLRGYDFATIDPSDARDHDDALWAQELESKDFRVLIAIADVAHYVRADSAIDHEAQRRSFSIYLPDRAIPMLPAKLSTDLCSLVPDRDRLTLGVDVTLSPDGSVLKHRFVRGVIRSRARLTYDGVANALGISKTAEPQRQAKYMLPQLKVLMHIAMTLRQRRLQQGALDLDIPEAKIRLDPSSAEPLDSYQTRKDPGIAQAYNMVEEFMLLANQVVARDFLKRSLATIYRVHGSPDPKKLETFAQTASAFGFKFDPDAAADPKELAKFIKQLSKSAHAPVLHMLLLRAMQQAQYDVHNIGHYGLASKAYLHFTSPIRRYPDLLVHREVHALLEGKPLNQSRVRQVLKLHAIQASRLERRAMSVEREIVDLYRAIIMRAHVGQSFEASITGIGPKGFYCTIAAPFVEVFCAVTELGDDYYDLDDTGLSWVGRRHGRRYTLGDKLSVRIEEVSIHQRQVLGIPEGMRSQTKLRPLKASSNRRKPASQRRQNPRRRAPRR
jgi:ribonuclease R